MNCNRSGFALGLIFCGVLLPAGLAAQGPEPRPPAPDVAALDAELGESLLVPPAPDAPATDTPAPGTPAAEASPTPAPETESPAMEEPETTEPEPGVESVAADAPTKEAVQSELEAAPLEAFDVRSRDEVWTISSRCVGSRNAPIESLQFRRRIEGDRWSNETADSFLAPDSNPARQHTVIFIHGNRTPEAKAIRRGLQTYDQTVLDWHAAPSMRFVIWLWPADQIPGQVRDVRIKAGRADEHAFHLARLLDMLQHSSHVSVIGYSFGGRLAVGAMHLVGGGSLCGSRLPMSSPAAAKINLALVVPAIRNDCFLCTRSQALRQVNHLFLMHNSRDQYLKLYRFLKLDDYSPALGFTGVSGLQRLQYSGVRIKQYNASQNVGNDHDYLEYVADKRIEALVRENLFYGSATNRQPVATPVVQRLP